MLLFILLLSFIAMICVLGIFVVHKYNELTKLLYKIGLSEKNISAKLKEEEDLVGRCINIIERKTDIKEKILTDIKNIKSDKLNNIDKDKLLTLGRTKIMAIAERKEELSKIKSIPDMLNDLKSIEEELIALRTYYNSNAKDFNKLICEFPYKLIAKVKKYKMKNYYEGKIINKETKNL